MRTAVQACADASGHCQRHLVHEQQVTHSTSHVMNTALQVVLQAFVASLDMLGMLFFLLVLLAILCSAVVYYAEEHVPNTEFTSIPASFWWSQVSKMHCRASRLLAVRICNCIWRLLDAPCSIAVSSSYGCALCT